MLIVYESSSDLDKWSMHTGSENVATFKYNQLGNKLNIQPAIDDLANHMSIVYTSQAYLRHVAATTDTMHLTETILAGCVE